MKMGKTSLMVAGVVLFLLGSWATADEVKGDPNKGDGSGKVVVKPESKVSGEPGGWILSLAWWLDLTKEQVAQIQGIVDEAQLEAKEAAEVVAAAQATLHEAVVNGATEEDIRVAAGALGIVIGDQAVLRAQTLTAIKAVLTEEQLKRFDAIKTKLPQLAQLLRNQKSHDADGKSPKPQDKTSKDQGDAGDKTPTKVKKDAGAKTSAEDQAAALVKLFKAADTNKDGVLTTEELNAYVKGVKGDQPAPKK
jgi:Spy/CpxP family protein refolding chaperone